MSELIDREALLDECLNHYEVGNIEQNCTMDWICKTVRNFPAAPRWVRCEERLPDDTFKQVLITDGTHFGLAYCLDLGVYGVKWRKTNWMSIGGLFRGKITHWMPMPEPPQEDA